MNENAETNGLAKFKEAVELLAEENGELLEGIRGVLLKIDEKKTEAERAAAGEGTGWYGEQGWKDIKVPDYIAADEAKAAADAKEMDEIRALTDPAAVAAAKDASTYGFGTKEGVSDADKEALIVKILAIEAEILALKEAKSKQGQGTSEGSRAHTGKIIKAKEDEIDALVDTTKTAKELNPALHALSGAADGAGRGLTQIWDSVSGGGWSKLISFWPSATGGHVTNKGIQGFAGGGKVPGVYKGKDSVPAMLSPGETVLTPGQLKGIGGSNTVVNVNMGEGGATISGQQSDSASAAAFGKAIAGAVNKEIAKQKRIGGTLYTQGPGGW